MNIREASKQIEGAVRAYLLSDDQGNPRIARPMQRPLVLMGPPGVGKTAIASQVADRLGIGFVSYSMTHHTRQSALGLPYIDQEHYGERDVRVSRYTMSEIIASVMDAIRRNASPAGILFLDEVNCVSETLAPAMLQFLQYKTFGQHRLPDRWVIVCAGNPPEYNRSAREFDPAMMDRLRRIDVEPDLTVWLDYASASGVHAAVTSYLETKPDSFYKVRAAATGARIVTARGWEDLSRMLAAYEELGLDADVSLISQYLQDRDIAEDFSLFYELFARYRDDYKVRDILAGTEAPEVRERARIAPFDERIALVNMLVESLGHDVGTLAVREEALRSVRERLAQARDALDSGGDAARDAAERLASDAQEDQSAARDRDATARRQAVLAWTSAAAAHVRDAVVRWLSGAGEQGGTGYDAARAAFNDDARDLARAAQAASGEVAAALSFVDGALGEQEVVVLMGRLATDPDFMRFVSVHGPASFAEHARALMFEERGLGLLEEARSLRDL